jgi:tetrahydromethanopterin S-methyltransferase subunit H
MMKEALKVVLLALGSQLVFRSSLDVKGLPGLPVGECSCNIGTNKGWLVVVKARMLEGNDEPAGISLRLLNPRKRPPVISGLFAM